MFYFNLPNLFYNLKLFYFGLYLYIKIYIMNKKEKQLLVKIDEEMLLEYKVFCKNNGYNMSQRIRNFIEKEIKHGK